MNFRTVTTVFQFSSRGNILQQSSFLVISRERSVHLISVTSFKRTSWNTCGIPSLRDFLYINVETDIGQKFGDMLRIYEVRFYFVFFVWEVASWVEQMYFCSRSKPKMPTHIPHVITQAVWLLLS